MRFPENIQHLSIVISVADIVNKSTVHSFPYHTNAGGIYRHLMIGEEPWDIILDPFAAEFRYYDALFQQTVQNNDLFVLVFNLTSRESFEWLDSWIRKVADIEQKLPRKGFLAIVGTHADLEHDRMVGIEEGRALAYRNKCGYVEISLSDHQGMDEFLERCVRMHVASRASTMAKSTLGKPLGAESRQSEISAEIMRDLVLERADCRFSVEDRGRLGFVARRKDEGVLAKVKRWFCGN